MHAIFERNIQAMKKIVISVSCLLSFVSAIAQTNNERPPGKFKQLEWLTGNWRMINSKKGMSGTESWTKISDSAFTGTGITLHGSDTAALEKLKIIKKGKDIFYIADLRENKEPVYFRMIKITSHEFVCENQEHDFPKMISYKKENNMLTATISGNGKSIDYLFEKVN